MTGTLNSWPATAPRDSTAHPAAPATSEIRRKGSCTARRNTPTTIPSSRLSPTMRSGARLNTHRVRDTVASGPVRSTTATGTTSESSARKAAVPPSSSGSTSSSTMRPSTGTNATTTLSSVTPTSTTPPRMPSSSEATSTRSRTDRAVRNATPSPASSPRSTARIRAVTAAAAIRDRIVPSRLLATVVVRSATSEPIPAAGSRSTSPVIPPPTIPGAIRSRSRLVTSCNGPMMTSTSSTAGPNTARNSR